MFLLIHFEIFESTLNVDGFFFAFNHTSFFVHNFLVFLFFFFFSSLRSRLHSCLRAIRQLQKNGHIPSDASLFKSYANYGHFVDVRVAALDALVDYTRGVEKMSVSAIIIVAFDHR